MDVPGRKAYPSDLTDEQWAIIEPLIPASKQGGRPREVDMREGNRSRAGWCFFQKTDLDLNAGFVAQQRAWNPSSRKN